MPLSQYDKFLGGDAEKAYREMIKQYGEKKGKEVFYRRLAKLRKAKSGGNEE